MTSTSIENVEYDLANTRIPFTLCHIPAIRCVLEEPENTGNGRSRVRNIVVERRQSVLQLQKGHRDSICRNLRGAFDEEKKAMCDMHSL